MTKLNESIAVIFLPTYSLSSALMRHTDVTVYVYLCTEPDNR